MLLASLAGTVSRYVQDCNPSLYNLEVPDLPNKIARHIPAHVQYACQHWASHLSSDNINKIILDLLSVFYSDQLFNWLGVMSLLSDLNGAMTVVKSVHKIVQVRSFKFVSSKNNNVGNRW
jgi:hypothetical protein